jgi:hypothetical protein
MLVKPSEILKNCNAREYAIGIYRQLLHRKKNTNGILSTVENSSFAERFHDEADAIKCQEHIISRIKASIEHTSDVEEEFFLLPPMFSVANKNAIVQLEHTNNIVKLVLCKSGPIVPVITIPANYSLHNDDKLLGHIISLYKRISKVYVDEYNIHTLLEDI